MRTNWAAEQQQAALICTQEHFDEMEQILPVVLEKSFNVL
jgi:hypothetical protein